MSMMFRPSPMKSHTRRSSRFVRKECRVNADPPASPCLPFHTSDTCLAWEHLSGHQNRIAGVSLWLTSRRAESTQWRKGKEGEGVPTVCLHLCPSLAGHRSPRAIELVVLGRLGQMLKSPGLSTDAWIATRSTLVELAVAPREWRPAALHPARHWFFRLARTHQIAESWRLDYNAVRPHSSFGNASPWSSGSARVAGHLAPFSVPDWSGADGAFR